jgi:arabinose-5-phosphate isomerase
MITAGDVVLAISNSGETDRVADDPADHQAARRAVDRVDGQGSLDPVRYATVTLDVSVPAEACPLNLAPTASTTATLAMGDALAVAVLEARGFTADDFARSHPGGTLGRRLLLHVEDVMRKGDQLPMVGPDTPLSAGLIEMSRKGLGMTTIVDDKQRVLGVFTDGDLRRALDGEVNVHRTLMREVMNAKCKVRSRACSRPKPCTSWKRFASPRCRSSSPLAEPRLVGALNVHDLLRAGVM